MKGQVAIIIIATLLIIITASLSVGYFFFKPQIKAFLNKFSAASDIVDQTINANNALYNYEWFKTQYQKIESSIKKIDNLEIEAESAFEFGEKLNWTYEATTDYQRIKSVLVGEKNFYNDLVAQYNARSAMANRNIFINGLPLHVENLLSI